jgi:hypothetical protein
MFGKEEEGEMSASRNILEERWRAFSDREQFDVIGHLNEIRAGDDDAYDTASKLLESLAMRAAAEPECSGNPDLRHDNCAADCGAQQTIDAALVPKAKRSRS